MERPHILLITTDQQRFDAAGEAAPSFMRTPHFDHLTREGVNFSAAYGGRIDTFIQRIIGFLMSFPAIPLWAALAAAMPANWSPLQRFFTISVILSLIEWTGLARQVRAKVLSYREMEYSLLVFGDGGG